MNAANPEYDRTTEDIGNLVSLEHLNLQVPDQQQATVFYVMGLGLTRDPFMMPGVEFMWINAGRNQFHLITGPEQVVGGEIGLIIPDLPALARRLEGVRPFLRGTRFEFTQRDGGIDAICPWGNHFRISAPDPSAGRMELGLPYLKFQVPPGTADAIAEFYREVLGGIARTSASHSDSGSGGASVAIVSVGMDQTLRFQETGSPLRTFDGHHIQVYVNDFSGPHKRLLERRLVTEESNQHQYRFDTIVDPKDGRALLRLEHEVRSVRHPLFSRPLVNRNVAQSSTSYLPGCDEWTPARPPHATEDPALQALRVRYLAWLGKD